MTICNMSIEAGARAGMIAPDETTFEYCRPNHAHLRAWNGMPRCHAGARSAPIRMRASTPPWTSMRPPRAMITYGTNPGMVMPLGGAIPRISGNAVYDKALGYMGFHGGEVMLGKPVDVVFIGSCTMAGWRISRPLPAS